MARGTVLAGCPSGQPKVVCAFDVEAFVQIEPQTKPRFTDVEEPAQPCDEEQDHSRVTVRESQRSVTFGALPGIKCESDHQEFALGELADALPSFHGQPLDFRQATR